jgi:lipopolysaccharide transport system ATP-binding protein
MSDTIIRVENLSKKYVISHQQEVGQYRTLRDLISNGTKSLSRKLLALDKQRDINPAYEEFWALKDVSFEIKQGDRVGIIGRNGAGKSTLLKILSRITEPTQGKISIKGRVASLLEVGTGFHPELTGRENIYLNGAILGMGKSEIKRKFDEIVDFSEVEKFLDTPVKRYSSGMYVRLAFAVAAHLEPEILIVDEVLAVGDASFQKKCLGKMQHISEDQGRTVLFVSHNREAIQRLCSTCILLDRGTLVSYGETLHTITQYLSEETFRAEPRTWINLTDAHRIGTGEVRFKSAQYSGPNPSLFFNAYPDGSLDFLLSIESNSSTSIGSLAVVIYDQDNNKLVNADTISHGQRIYVNKGHNNIRLRIKELHLNPGIYVIGLWAADPYTNTVFDFIKSAFEFEVVNLGTNGFGVRPDSDGVVTCSFELSPSENFEYSNP